MGITREVGIIPVERSSGGSRTSIRICSGFAVAEVICEIRGGLVSWSREWVDGCRETYVFEVVGFYFWGRGVWGFCGGGFEADVVFACEGLRRG